MTAHGVAEDTHTCRVARQGCRSDFEQLLGDIGFHAVMPGPRFLRGIHIKAGARAEVPVIIFPLNTGATRAGVRRDQHEAQFCGPALSTALDHEGFLGAGQPREVEQDRHTTLFRLRGYKYRETHRQADGARRMFVKRLRSAEAAMTTYKLQSV